MRFDTRSSPRRLAGTAVSWSPTRVGGYGSVLGYQAPVLSGSTPLAETLVWRGRRIDPSGFCFLGARYYDPVAGRFLSPDPVGFAGSTWDLYSFADNDPINRFDPDGRFGRDTFAASPYRSGADLFGQSGGYLNRNFADVGPTWFERLNQRQAIGDMWRGYQQTEADMFQARYGAYFQPERQTLGQFFSGALDLSPVGGIKEAFEQGISGRDLVTGERVEAGSALMAGIGLVAGFTPIGPEARAGRMMFRAESRLLSTELRAGTQMELGFVRNNLSGQLTGWNATAGGEGLLHFSQESVGRAFTSPELSPFKYAGKSIADVARGLRSGEINPNEIPVRYIVDNGMRIAVDNRSLLALRRAGLEPTVLIDVTSDAALRAQTLQRVADQLGGIPSRTIRVSGAGRDASLIE